MRIAIFVLLVMSLLPMVIAADERTVCESCTNEINNKNIEISILRQEIAELNYTMNELNESYRHYYNLSEYYYEVYMESMANVTNRELFLINQNIHNFNTTLNEIEEKISNYNLNLGLAALSGSVIGTTIIELVIRWRRRERATPALHSRE